MRSAKAVSVVVSSPTGTGAPPAALRRPTSLHGSVTDSSLSICLTRARASDSALLPRGPYAVSVMGVSMA